MQIGQVLVRSRASAFPCDGRVLMIYALVFARTHVCGPHVLVQQAALGGEGRSH